jgi:pimeloyl-ACP methyl ester carboxylesterase
MAKRFAPIIGALMVASIAAGLSSCSGARSLADRLVVPDRPQSQSAKLRDQVFEALRVPARKVRFEGGPSQTYWLLPPLPFAVTSDFTRERNRFTLRFNLHVDTEHAPAAEPPEEVGSMVLLHGWGGESSMMLPWAASFSALGYRSLLVDLRNHGLSGTAPAGYGLREGQDIVHLIRYLRAQGELPRPIYLFGLSYGASAAIVAAAQLDGEIDGLIALAPFDDPTEAVGGMIESVKSDRSGFARRARAAFVRQRYTPERIDAAIAEAGERLDLDLRNPGIGDALSRVNACTLLIHGVKDAIVPVQASRRLAARNARAALIELANDDHITLAMRFGWLGEPLVDWAAGVASDGDCRPPSLPPDPLATAPGD